MAQLHFYIPDSVADKIKIKAEHAHLSVSKYLAELAKREVASQWPEDYLINLVNGGGVRLYSDLIKVSLNNGKR